MNNKNVFVSYSRRDYKDDKDNIIPGNAVSKILTAFDNAGITYWIDDKGVYSGDKYANLIASAIKQCDIFLFVSSEAANASEWTSSEIAAAKMYNKRIVPFRLDETPFNESVILYIAKLDFIDYFRNNNVALSKLVDSVKQYIKTIKEEENKRLLEEEKLKEKKNLEQKKIISEIELGAEELDNDERDAELKRRKLIQATQNIENKEEKDRLLTIIDNSGSMHKKRKDETIKLQTLYEEIAQQSTEIEALTKEKDVLQTKIDELSLIIRGNLSQNTSSKITEISWKEPFKKISFLLKNRYISILFATTIGLTIMLFLSLFIPCKHVLISEDEKETYDLSYLKTVDTWNENVILSKKYWNFYQTLKSGISDSIIYNDYSQGRVGYLNGYWKQIIRGMQNIVDNEELHNISEKISIEANRGSINLPNLRYHIDKTINRIENEDKEYLKTNTVWHKEQLKSKSYSSFYNYLEQGNADSILFFSSMNMTYTNNCWDNIINSIHNEKRKDSVLVYISKEAKTGVFDCAKVDSICETFRYNYRKTIPVRGDTVVTIYYNYRH